MKQAYGRIIPGGERGAHPRRSGRAHGRTPAPLLAANACGRTHALVVCGPAGRPDDMVKVRGVVLSPSTIEAVVRLVPQLTNEFLMVLSNEGGMPRTEFKAKRIRDRRRKG